MIRLIKGYITPAGTGYCSNVNTTASRTPKTQHSKVNWAVNTLKRCLSVSCPLRPTATDFKAALFIPQKIHRFEM